MAKIYLQVILLVNSQKQHTVDHVNNGGVIRLASGDEYTGHADFFNGWHTENQKDLVDECIKANIECADSEFDSDADPNAPDPQPKPKHDILKLSQFSDRSSAVNFLNKTVTGSQNRVFLEIHDPGDIWRVRFFERQVAGNYLRVGIDNSPTYYDLVDGSTDNNALPYIFEDMNPTVEKLKILIDYTDGRARKRIITKYKVPTTNDPIVIGIASSNDDAEERINGTVNRTSKDLQLVNDGTTNGDQHVGMIFRDIDIDPNVDTITTAYIQFTVDEVDTLQTTLTIKGEKNVAPAGFLGTSNNISNRVVTNASVSWQPAGWSVVGEATATQQTTDITSIIEEVMNSGGWVPGSSDIAIIITGTGTRTAESWDGSNDHNGDNSLAPTLHIEY